MRMNSLCLGVVSMQTDSLCLGVINSIENKR